MNRQLESDKVMFFPAYLLVLFIEKLRFFAVEIYYCMSMFVVYCVVVFKYRIMHGKLVILVTFAENIIIIKN